MPRKRALGLTWLNVRDLDQITWAENYIRERKSQLQKYSLHLSHARYGYTDLITIGDDLEKEIEDGGDVAAFLKSFLNDMKAAARGEKFRRKQRDSGVQKIVISGKASKQLSALAVRKKMSESAILEQLIERSYRANNRTKKQTDDVQKASPSPFERPSIQDVKAFFLEESQTRENPESADQQQGDASSNTSNITTVTDNQNNSLSEADKSVAYAHFAISDHADKAEHLPETPHAECTSTDSPPAINEATEEIAGARSTPTIRETMQNAMRSKNRIRPPVNPS